MEWLAQGENLGVSLALMTVRPGAVSPAHRHENCNEVIHLLQGAIQQRRADGWVALQAGGTITIMAGDVHQTRNDADIDAVMMIAYSSGARAYEEIIE